VGRALRERTGLILRIGGVVMVLAGAWVIVYGLAELLPRYGVTALNEVLLRSSRAQGNISNAITDWGTPVLVTVLALVVAAIVVVFAVARRDSARNSVRIAHDGPASTTADGGATTGQASGSRAPLTASPDVLDAIRKAAAKH